MPSRKGPESSKSTRLRPKNLLSKTYTPPERNGRLRTPERYHKTCCWPTYHQKRVQNQARASDSGPKNLLSKTYTPPERNGHSRTPERYHKTGFWPTCHHDRVQNQERAHVRRNAVRTRGRYRDMRSAATTRGCGDASVRQQIPLPCIERQHPIAKGSRIKKEHPTSCRKTCLRRRPTYDKSTRQQYQHAVMRWVTYMWQNAIHGNMLHNTPWCVGSCI
jgi:hypothetical protein